MWKMAGQTQRQIDGAEILCTVHPDATAQLGQTKQWGRLSITDGELSSDCHIFLSDFPRLSFFTEIHTSAQNSQRAREKDTEGKTT